LVLSGDLSSNEGAKHKQIIENKIWQHVARRAAPGSAPVLQEPPTPSFFSLSHSAWYGVKTPQVKKQPRPKRQW